MHQFWRVEDDQLPVVQPPGAPKPPPLAVGEVDMKDPIVVCPACKMRGARIRKLAGIRCTTTGCADVGKLIAADGEINLLKLYLKREEELELLNWAMGCQL